MVDLKVCPVKAKQFAEQYRKEVNDCKVSATKLNGRCQYLHKEEKAFKFEFKVKVIGNQNYSLDDLINHLDGGYAALGGRAFISFKHDDYIIWEGEVYTHY